MGNGLHSPCAYYSLHVHELSSWNRPILPGVPQGSILIPLIFYTTHSLFICHVWYITNPLLIRNQWWYDIWSDWNTFHRNYWCIVWMLKRLIAWFYWVFSVTSWQSFQVSCRQFKWQLMKVELGIPDVSFRYHGYGIYLTSVRRGFKVRLWIQGKAGEN